MLHPSHADLDRYRLDQLSDNERRVIRHHLICCTLCARTLLDAARLTDLVRTLIEGDAVSEYTET
jgi:hypothetical protein